MTNALDRTRESNERLTLAQAARLTGMPKAYLRELVDSGRLAVYLMPGDGEVKQRVTRNALIEAGLLEPDPAARDATPDRDLGELISLVREQSNRIGVLEEQRFQLGAQLGAAVERIASLEEQVQSLPLPSLHEPRAEELPPVAEIAQVPMIATNGHESASLRGAAWRLGELGLHRSASFGLDAARTGARLFGRVRRNGGR
ncbi:MAG: hypothetical protein IT336_02710 [Thermomicrobiales bacterium]|nr:hypothetical protein [Thermomicrobiales bacterium]